MDTARWEKLKDIFAEAIEAAPDQRLAVIEKLAGDDKQLRAEALELLSADDAPNEVFTGPSHDRLTGILEQPEETQVGPYRLIKRLGSGGMGIVFLAERTDGQFKQQVALKLIKRGMDSEEISARFRGERQILAQLHHPNIARLFDGGVSESGQPYFTLEYVDGVPITDYCNTHNLSARQRLQLFVTVCEAVQYAHQNLVIHRDLKPRNALVDANGRVKLIDFGIAKILGEDSESEELNLTRTGIRVHTPAYASPEQLRGETASTASDVYSLGVILYELLTGQRPYRDSVSESQTSLRDTPPSRPSDVVTDRSSRKSESADETLRRDGVQNASELKGDLDNICLKALSPEQERRYNSAGQLAEDITRFLRGFPVIARPDSTAYRVSKFLKRNKIAVAFAAVTLAVVVSMTVYYTQQLSEERDRAQLEAEKATQVAKFMQNILESADPNISKGEELTVVEMLDATAKDLDSALLDQPELKLTLINTIAASYFSLGHFPETREVLRKGQQLYEQGAVPLNVQVAFLYGQLGTIANELREYDTAIVYDSIALRYLLQLNGEHDSTVAEAYTALAASTRRKGDYEGADSLYRRGLQIRLDVFGPDHPDVAHSLNHLGRLLYQQGKYDEAEPYLKDGLRIRLDVYGPENFETIASQGAYMGLLRAQGLYDSALTIAIPRHKALLKMVGENHPYVGSSFAGLGYLFTDKGDYRGADTCIKKCIAVFSNAFPPDNPSLIEPYNGLGRVYTNLGKLDSAESILRKALSIAVTTGGPKHISTANSQTFLGECLIAQKRYDEATAYLEPALETMTDQYGTDDFKTQKARKLLNEARSHLN